MLVIDGNGLPMGFHLDSATAAEVRLAERTLDTISAARPHGRPKRWPERLVADHASDSREFRHVVRRRGSETCIQAKRFPATWRAQRGRPRVARMEEYRLRYTVERSFAWLENDRRLLIRWERLFHLYRSCFACAVMLVMLLCVKRLARFEAETPTAPS